MAAEGAGIERAVAIVRDNFVAWIYYAELALPFVALAALALSAGHARKAWPNSTVKIAVVIFLAVVLEAGFLRSPLEARLADPSVPLLILCAWLPAALFATLRSGLSLRPAGRTAAAWVTLLAGTALLLVMAVAVTRGGVGRLQKTRLDRGPRPAVRQAEDMWRNIGRAFPVRLDEDSRADGLTTLAVYLRECTAPTDRVFMQHYAPQVVALSERGFAGGHADLRPGFFETEQIQRLTVDRLRRQSVPMVLLGPGQDFGGFREAFPIVVRYFDEEYRVAGERTFDERFPMRLLIRRDAMPVRFFEPIGWPCFR
jgi:hypothetical protein